MSDDISPVALAGTVRLRTAPTYPISDGKSESAYRFYLTRVSKSCDWYHIRCDAFPGLVYDVRGGKLGDADGYARAQMYPELAADAPQQHWRLDPATHTIVSRLTYGPGHHGVLDLADGQIGADVDLNLYGPTGMRNQQWQMSSEGHIVSGLDPTMFIVARNVNLFERGVRLAVDRRANVKPTLYAFDRFVSLEHTVAVYHDQAIALTNQCGQFADERDAAIDERDRAAADRDQARAERDAALADCAKMRAARDRAIAERDRMRMERDTMEKRGHALRKMAADLRTSLLHEDRKRMQTADWLEASEAAKAAERHGRLMAIGLLDQERHAHARTRAACLCSGSSNHSSHHRGAGGTGGTGGAALMPQVGDPVTQKVHDLALTNRQLVERCFQLVERIDRIELANASAPAPARQPFAVTSGARGSTDAAPSRPHS